MIKAIVSSLEELNGLPEAEVGYKPVYEQGDEAVVGGAHLILIGGAWTDYEAHMKAEAERIKAEEKKAEVQ